MAFAYCSDFQTYLPIMSTIFLYFSMHVGHTFVEPTYLLQKRTSFMDDPRLFQVFLEKVRRLKLVDKSEKSECMELDQRLWPIRDK